MQNSSWLPRRTGAASGGLWLKAGRAVSARTRIAACGVVATLLVGCGEPAPQVSDDGWHTLLDGSSLVFWDILGDANWRIEEGAAVADESTAASFLVSQQVYDDFELELEFWVTTEANSGIFLRCQDAAGVTDTSCYEVNIFDTRPDQTYRTGGIVNLTAPTEFIYTGGQWNRYQIRAEGDRLQVTLNGRDIVDVEDSQFASGPVALQYGSGEVKFRNVRIRPL